MNADISWLPQRSKLLTAFNVVATVWLIGLTALRTYWNYSVAAGQFDWENRGLSDFHNGTYYPTLAIRNGDTPYVPGVVTAVAVRKPLEYARELTPQVLAQLIHRMEIFCQAKTHSLAQRVIG